MKLFFPIIAGLFVLGGCKQTAPQVSEEANRMKVFMPSFCKNEKEWHKQGCERDQYTKQIRFRQVVVKFVYRIHDDLKMKLSRNNPPIDLCVGDVLYWDRGEWKDGKGFWLNGLPDGLNSLAGCYTGVDYKLHSFTAQNHSGLNSKNQLITFDNKGANVVSVPPNNFYLFNPIHDVFLELCTGDDYQKLCSLSIVDGALEIRPTKSR